MNRDALLWTAKPPPPRQPKPGEPLWSLRNGERRLDCELRDDGKLGVEAQNVAVVERPLLRALEETDDVAVVGIRGHPVIAIVALLAACWLLGLATFGPSHEPWRLRRRRRGERR